MGPSALWQRNCKENYGAFCSYDRFMEKTAMGVWGLLLTDKRNWKESYRYGTFCSKIHGKKSYGMGPSSQKQVHGKESLLLKDREKEWKAMRPSVLWQIHGKESNEFMERKAIGACLLMIEKWNGKVWGLLLCDREMERKGMGLLHYDIGRYS